MDDVLVWGKTVQVPDQRLEEAKARIKKYGVIMNWDKCELRRA
jgi:adenine/guanine phosphoribosyltransferase-like PRPP-binding protein